MIHIKIVFYFTNHGYGHASRNVPIIQELIRRKKDIEIVVKSDKVRIDYLKRNMPKYIDNIRFCEDCCENGFLLRAGTLHPEVGEMEKTIQADLKKWNNYVLRETEFLRTWRPDLVYTDIVPWALSAAHICHTKSILAGNFLWSEMYKAFFEEDIWKPYEDCYELAEHAMWYELHPEELHRYCTSYECISMVARAVNPDMVAEIKARHHRPMVFISFGGAATLGTPINVQKLPYDFVVTSGINLKGDNVYNLPVEMINTSDYIAASDYVIAKGGWSTVAEILLQKRKCALLFRGANPEDECTKSVLEVRRHCITIGEEDLFDLDSVLARLDAMNPGPYDMYTDDTGKICDRILEK